MKFKQYSLIVSILFFIIISACNNSENKEVQKSTDTKSKVEKKTEITKTQSVCILDRGSVRKTPKKKGKYLSAMSLGEKVLWLGKTETDSLDKNKKYYNVELSDGTIGWVSEYVIAVNAKPAIAIKDIPIYRRPDLLTLTESSFTKMEFIAVLKKNSEWLEVLGKRKKKKGWIKVGLVSYSDDNIAVGLLAAKAFELKDSLKRHERLEAIINNPSFSKSVFINKLKKMLKEPMNEY